MSLQEASRPTHLPAIGALRGIAALYVVAFHMTLVPAKRPAISAWLQPLVETGFTGVPLFFVVSAFTLCHSMNSHSSVMATGNFYVRRLFRILPLFYFLLAVSIAFRIVSGRPVPQDREVLLSVLVLFNLVPGMEQGIVYASWSIGVEMLFYAMFPPIFRFVRTVPRALVFLAAALVASFAFERLVGFLPLSGAVKHSFFRYSLAGSMPCFAVGMLVYQLYDERILERARARLPWLGAALIGASAALFVCLAYGHVSAFPPHAAMHGLLVSGLLLTPVRVLVNRITEFFGDISYSVYLWHPLVILSVSWFYPAFYTRFPITLAWCGCLALTLPIVVALAFVTFHLIEEPGRRIGATLIRRHGSLWPKRSDWSGVIKLPPRTLVALGSAIGFLLVLSLGMASRYSSAARAHGQAGQAQRAQAQ